MHWRCLKFKNPCKENAYQKPPFVATKFWFIFVGQSQIDNFEDCFINHFQSYQVIL